MDFVQIYTSLQEPQQEEVLSEIRQEIAERTTSLTNTITRVNVLAPVQGGLIVGAITLMAQVPQLNRVFLALMIAFELLGLSWSVSVLWHRPKYLLPRQNYDDVFVQQVLNRDYVHRFNEHREKLNRRGQYLLHKRRLVLIAGMLSVAGIAFGGIAGIQLAIHVWGAAGP